MKLDRYTMAWELALTTRYSDEYLLKLSDEELEKLYRERVLKQNG